MRRAMSIATALAALMTLMGLIGLAVLIACSSISGYLTQPTPTVYYAPATPAVYVPFPPLPDGQVRSETATILLLGIDRRPVGGSLNTDTIMLFRIDPQNQTIAILSIPRDLYVDIPGHGPGRVNTAYASGEGDGTGGLALARQTVSDIAGIPVEHAALLDFDSFVTFVDAIGGIDVDVPYAISDPTYPDSGIGYDPFYMPAGLQHLDGITALKYARTRATPGGDFTRIARQRQVVLAVRDRILDLNLLPSLIAQSPQLWTTFQDSLETDLSLGTIVDLAIAANSIPSEQIKTAAIDETCTTPWVTPNGASVLLPDQAEIDAMLADLFSPSTIAASTP